jgi:hypothetical protein
VKAAQPIFLCTMYVPPTERMCGSVRPSACVAKQMWRECSRAHMRQCATSPAAGGVRGVSPQQPSCDPLPPQTGTSSARGFAPHANSPCARAGASRPLF